MLETERKNKPDDRPRGSGGAYGGFVGAGLGYDVFIYEREFSGAFPWGLGFGSGTCWAAKKTGGANVMAGWR